MESIKLKGGLPVEDKNKDCYKPPEGKFKNANGHTCRGYWFLWLNEAVTISIDYPQSTCNLGYSIA